MAKETMATINAKCDVCKLNPYFYKGSRLGKYVFFCPTCLDKENK